jgi:hypothetical protein
MLDLRTCLPHFQQQYWIPRVWPVIWSTLQKCLQCFAKGSCISEGGSAPDSTSATGMAVFELWYGLCRTNLFQTRIPKEQDSSQMLCHPLHLPNCEGSSSELINTRWLYCCPLKVDYMKGEMFKYAFWQWDNICWSSSWSLRTQDNICFRSTSGKTSGICKFRSIYMAFLFPHTPQMLGGLQKAGTCSVNHLRRVVGVTAFTFQELSTLLTQEEARLNSHPLDSFIQWCK